MDPLKFGYLLLFGGAALACYGSVPAASRVTAPDARRGLVALLLFSGTWALASVGRLIAPGVGLQATFYTVGLVVGLGTVGAWLYFCSAYAGHDYHRESTLRTIALAAYLTVVTVKLTNPLHGLYYSGAMDTVPFRHLVVTLHPIHWVVTGLSYALTAVGFYLLYELFRESRFDTTRLSVLVALTGLPAVLDVLAYTEAVPGLLLKFNFEPVGVAVFAVGALYVVDERFVAVPRFWRRQVLDYLQEAVVVVDCDDVVRDYNSRAVELFPVLADGVGRRLPSVAPRLAAPVRADEDLFIDDAGGDTRYYRVQTRALSAGGVVSGRVLIYVDVTDVERQRRELQRQTEQFDEFAEAITHELRNTLSVVDGYLGLVGKRAAPMDDDGVPDAIKRAGEAVEQMEETVANLTRLARYGQPPQSLADCDVGTVVAAAHNGSPLGSLAVEVATGGTVRADPPRLEELFRSAFRFAAANGAARVSVAVEDGAITLTDDGTWLDTDRVEQAFAYGEPVPADDAGMTLPTVRVLARVHGWDAAIDTAYEDGVRLRLDGVEVVEVVE